MISASDRQLAVTLIQEAIDAGARKGRACKELGIHPRTFKRWADPNTPDDDQRPHALSRTQFHSENSELFIR